VLVRDLALKQLLLCEQLHHSFFLTLVLAELREGLQGLLADSASEVDELLNGLVDSAWTSEGMLHTLRSFLLDLRGIEVGLEDELSVPVTLRHFEVLQNGNDV